MKRSRSTISQKQEMKNSVKLQESRPILSYATGAAKPEKDNDAHYFKRSHLGLSHVPQERLLNELERLIRRDPARRGLIATEEQRGPLCPDHLGQAATHLAENGQRVIIVTGFYIPGATPPAAETDGPPGAAMLATALTRLGMAVEIVTDPRCHNAVKVAANSMQLPEETVICPGESASSIDQWFNQNIAETTRPPLTHLIAIERAGPSHTRESILRDASPDNSETPPHSSTLRDESIDLAEFERLVPESTWNRCHNMRGICIDDFMSPLHRLFELADDHEAIATIGIGDGGNEIGMGSIRWREIQERLSSPAVAHIPCRIKTDWTIVAGVSNWGGMALAAATLSLRHQLDVMKTWTSQQQLRLLEQLVEQGPAVDGITRLPEATVDGLPFLTYIQPWEGIRRAVGFSN